MMSSVVLCAQEPIEHDIIAKVKMEALGESQVMETFGYLTDVSGPRLTNSPNFKAAAQWCIEKLAEWGLSNTTLEPWGTYGEGWSIERFNIEMLKPDYMRINGYPKAWTPSTKDVVSGQPVLVDIQSEQDFEQYRGKLNNAIVMRGSPGPSNPHFEADATRHTDSYLQSLENVLEPKQQQSQAWLARRTRNNAIKDFFAQEGVRLLLEPTSRDHGVVRVNGYDVKTKTNYPVMVLAREHFGRIFRLVKRDVPVELEVSIHTAFHEDSTAYNVVAEIPGEDKKLKSEISYVGRTFGFLAYWHWCDRQRW
jgi:hypothetical protein